MLIPLAEPISGEDYADAQLALFDLMQLKNIACDSALSRTGQPIYLPNVPPARRDEFGTPSFYHGITHRGDGLLIPTESRIWANMRFAARMKPSQQKEPQQSEHCAHKQREEKRNKYDGDDPIDVFNQRHTISDIMLKYGYERKGRSDSYRSPMQSSGSFATKDFGTHWVSLSGSDRASGIGQASGEFCYGDAFDIWAHFEHGGRMSDAVREYGKEIRPTPAKQREEIVKAASDPYADFDMVPDARPQQSHRCSLKLQSSYPTPNRSRSSG